MKRQEHRTHHKGSHTIALLKACSGRFEPLTTVCDPKWSFSARQSITSLARARSESGTVRPSALAVLRLITSSTLVLCWFSYILSSRLGRHWLKPYPQCSSRFRPRRPLSYWRHDSKARAYGRPAPQTFRRISVSVINSKRQ